ncbi:MAG: cyclomaltodextrinase C-terminal domain-containing protein [Verrucomicrobia bacterium]|nr:cyclomaltodextrinase C-terminal domain-containing protein [Cytophagales bacterium]
MKNSEVQIHFHQAQADMTQYIVSLDYQGVKIRNIKTVENPHFLFVTLTLSPDMQAGKIPLRFTSHDKKQKTFTHLYEFKEKSKETNRILGFSPADVLYLIMPDRFANGNTKNDSLPGFFQGVHREQPFGRHGGDLQGISDHLDYVKNLGITTLWFNPVLENNQKNESYHGYAITDLYKVDARFGSNEEYVKLIEKCHQNGLKVVQDMVANHIGDQHWLMKDLPEKSWIHYYPNFKPTSYRTGVPSDPHASKADLNEMTDGWFVAHMPDVNQTNELFANYLIQNSLWWIEYAGIDGIRMDTYPYPDKDFMARWAKTLLTEYPSFNIVGESWINSVPMTAYWQKGVKNNDGYASELPSVTDFPFCFAVPQALNEESGWDNGLSRLHFLLAQDFAYANPNANLTFLDNHDMTRFFLSVGKDLDKFKMGLTFLLTTRGTPQLYYGTELLMDGDGASHPEVRKTMPGGWKGDATNVFEANGRSPQQNEAYNFLKTLLDWRKTKQVIHQGKLTHYVPADNVYVYFRHDEKQTVMVVMNGNKQAKMLNTNRFKENIKKFTKARNILSGTVVNDLNTIQIPAKTALVLELE